MRVYEPPSFPTPIDLDLSRNEGRLTVEDIVLDSEKVGNLIRRYPDTTRLTGLVAARHGVGEDRVVVTAGGDDAILRCFLRGRGSRVVSTTPTFEMISRYATQTDATLEEIPWWDGALPLEELVGVEADMAVIVSPNNPTGSTIEESDLLALADRFRLVVLDAAYAEFANIDLTPAALRFDNIVVIRTLSKAYGLAGLRVGYLLGPADVVSEVSAFGSPYAVSGLSAALAADVLETSTEQVSRFVGTVVSERRRLIELLTGLGARPLPSEANFVLATNTSAETTVAAAASVGVGLRHFPNRPGLERCVRIGLPGDAAEFSRLVRVLRAVLVPDQELEVLDVS